MQKQLPQIMGIINLTPDSFSDGGKFNTKETAVKKVKEMISHGADIIDLGAESSGPNSKNVSLDEELTRILPILKAIREITDIPISIDTYKSQVANECLSHGANIINDITGLRGDTKMAQVAEAHDCPIILMYSKDPTARTTLKDQEYQDVIATIKDFFQTQIPKTLKPQNIIIDPGMGHFISSMPKYSYEIIARLNELQELGHKILIGISRKSFLGGSLKTRDDRGLPLTAIAYLNGASIIRTHNVKATKEFFKHLN